MAFRQSVRLLSTSKRRRRFVDNFRLQLSGGRGGNGCLSQRRLGPVKSILDGGNGGTGGSVRFRACRDTQSLNFPSAIYKARPGANGGSNNKHGKAGKDLVLRVPVGTVVRFRSLPELGLRFETASDFEVDDQGEQPFEVEDEDDADGGGGGEAETEEMFEQVADLIEDGQEFVAAAGGPGGRGNADISSPFVFKRGQPRYAARAEGGAGASCVAELSLKTIADVGLVGFPNAGKSTLLGAVSSSTPEVAAYPFTTLHPYVGVVRFTDAERFTIADIPGLVEGASENKGLGHRFLRHVERTSVLAYVIDASQIQTKTLVGDFVALVTELERYQTGLSSKPCMLFLNKLDKIQESESSGESESASESGSPLQRWNEELQALQLDAPEVALTLPQVMGIVEVSAMQGHGLRDAVHKMRHLLEGTGLSMGEGLHR